MRVQQFLEHHGIAQNPFADEDAQTDPVFKRYCIDHTYHPAWDKIFGQPIEPATSVVFGEKGSGKTAMRLQIDRQLSDHNAAHPNRPVFVIRYDDFNPFLERLVSRLSLRRRRIDRALAAWKLWDHMDAILALAVTEIVDWVIDPAGKRPGPESGRWQQLRDRLDRHQRRDLLLLAACYDFSTAQPFPQRWRRLRRAVRFSTLRASLPWWLGLVGSVGFLVLAIYFFAAPLASSAERNAPWPSPWSPLALAAVAWLPWLWKAARRYWLAASIVRNVRVGNRTASGLWHALMHLTSAELAGQPIPNRDRSEDRYELLNKLQTVLQRCGYQGIYILVDRVDEPYVINGSAELMRMFIWPLLDNKFLKHPGLGVKLMLPIELAHFVAREGPDFYQRARLDKQNMIPSLVWTGEALFDVANARLHACARDGRQPDLRAWFDDSISQQRLYDAFATLRVPRHLHKFMHRLLVSHCNAHADSQPVWRIARERFESELAVFRRELEVADRGAGVA